MSYYTTGDGTHSPLARLFIWFCYALLVIMVILLLLTVFNMDLFMSYFSRMSMSNDFGSFFSILLDYIIAVFTHTFGL